MAQYDTTLTDIQTDIAYNLGETSVATGDDYTIRNRFINNRIKEIWDDNDFEHLATLATVTLTSGSVTIATKPNGLLDLRSSTSGTDHVFTEVPYEKFDDYTASDYVYYKNGTVYKTNSTDTYLTAKYIPKSPSLATAADTIDMPSQLLARGAVMDVRYSEDPEADLTKEEETYSRLLEKFVGAENVGNTRIFESISYPLGEA